VSSALDFGSAHTAADLRGAQARVLYRRCRAWLGILLA